MAKSKVKSRSQHDGAHLLLLTNVTIKYQLSTHYGFRDITRTIIYKSRSLWQDQRLNWGHTMMLHIYHPNQCPYQVSTSYILQFATYIAQTRFSNSRSLWQGQIKVTQWHCTPTSPNQCPYQVVVTEKKDTKVVIWKWCSEGK